MAEAAPPQAKGSSVVGLVKLARKHRDRFREVLAPDTLEWIETRVLMGSWYPEVHLRNLLLAADRVFGSGDLEQCRQLGRTAAREVLASVYKTALVPGDPLATIRLLPVVWSLQHDTGRVTLGDLTDDGVAVRLMDFGLPNPPLCLACCGWLEGAARAAGARAAWARDERCRARGDDECRYAVSWSMGS